jgi:hypothetical protein
VSDFWAPMRDKSSASIRPHFDEDPPAIALVARNRVLTPIETYLRLLQSDRIDLVNEIERLRGSS